MRNNKGAERREKTKERINDRVPSITVLMSVYNGERYLREAIESILNQTFSDFEFMVIDDGSTDKSWPILAEYAEQDSRLVLIRNQENIGLAKSLNKGLALARGKYIARMDADDVSMPQRFEKQVVFLETHSKIGILGTQCWFIDTNGQEQELDEAPTDELQLRWTSLFGNPFRHPTVMIRGDVLRKNGLKYDEAFRVTQDYEFWTRILKYTDGANLSTRLLKYRNGYGISSTQAEMQLKNRDLISQRVIREQMPESTITSTQIKQMQALFFGVGGAKPALDSHIALAELYLDVLEAFMKSNRGRSDLIDLQRRETCKVARVLLRPPRLARWGVAGRLISTDLGMLRFFLYDFFSTVKRKLNLNMP